jgi:hypothetical protein
VEEVPMELQTESVAMVEVLLVVKVVLDVDPVLILELNILVVT